MLSVKVIFPQRGINFLSQAARSACGTACVAHQDPSARSCGAVHVFNLKTQRKAIKVHFVLYII